MGRIETSANWDQDGNKMEILVNSSLLKFYNEYKSSNLCDSAYRRLPTSAVTYHEILIKMNVQIPEVVNISAWSSVHGLAKYHHGACSNRPKYALLG